METNLKRIISITITLILIFSLAACNETTPSVTDSESSIISTEESIDPFEKYDETIKLTSIKAIPNPALFKVDEGNDFENNVWMDTIKDELNIEVEYLWMADDSQYLTRFNTMIASGNIPDFFSTDLASAAQLYEADLLQEVGTAFDKYAWSEVKDIYELAGEFVMDVSKFDGKMYGIPFISGAREFAQVLYVREDWLENLNLPVPKTIDDVISTAIAFANDDPDQNGQKDTYGFAVNADTTGQLIWHLGFFNAYDSFPTIWHDDGEGNLVYGSVTSQTKTALAALNNLYNKGAIDPEFVTADFWSIYEPAGAGTYGMMYGPYYIAYAPLGTLKQANYDTTGNWIPIPLPGKEDVSSVQAGAAASNFWVVSKECKNPEAVVKLLNFWYEKFYFTKDEDTFYTFINRREDGNPTYNFSPIQSYKEFHNLSIALGAENIISNKKSIEESKYLDVNYYNTIKGFFEGDTSLWPQERSFVALRDVISVYKDENNYVQQMNYAPADTENMIGAEMSNLYTKEMEYFTKIISGAIPVDDFDEFVDIWENGGGKAYTDYVNQWYQKVK